LALSPQQREVLALIVRGLLNKEIARRLNLAVGTVKIHVAVLFHTRRLGKGLARITGVGAPPVLSRAPLLFSLIHPSS
jgi:FixJ family two-component response regulator